MVALKDKQEPLRIHFERARDQLAELNGSPVGAAGPWHETRLQVRVRLDVENFSRLRFSRFLDLSLLLQENLRSRCQLRS
jgi:hypothetical protein